MRKRITRGALGAMCAGLLMTAAAQASSLPFCGGVYLRSGQSCSSPTTVMATASAQFMTGYGSVTAGGRTAYCFVRGCTATVTLLRPAVTKAVATDRSASGTFVRGIYGNSVLPAGLARFMRVHPGGKLLTEGMVLGPLYRKKHARVSDSVTGNCGKSFLYIGNASGIGHGWIQEYFGVSLDYPMLGGSGTVSWTNGNTGGHSAFLWAFGGNINGNAHDVRNAYTHVGWIYAVMYASAVVLDPFPSSCHTPYGEPYSVTYAS